MRTNRLVRPNRYFVGGPEGTVPKGGKLTAWRNVTTSSGAIPSGTGETTPSKKTSPEASEAEKPQKGEGMLVELDWTLRVLKNSKNNQPIQLEERHSA